MKKIVLIVTIIALFAILLSACSSSTTATQSSSGSTSSTLDGKGLLEARCVSCHSLAKVASAHGTASQWQSVVSNMVQRGAQLSTDEQKVLVDYLAANFQ